MTITADIIDIGEEVTKFAHEQGHTKAHKDVINWHKLETKSGHPKYTVLSNKKYTVSFSGKEGRYKDLVKHVTVKEYSQFSNEPVSIIADTEQNLTASCASDKKGEKIELYESFLLNRNEDKKLCMVTFAPSLKNTAEANVWFTTTLLCAKEDAFNCEEKHQVKEKRNSTQHKSSFAQRRKSVITDQSQLRKVPLSPKIPTELSLKTIHRRQIALLKNKRHELIAKIPPGLKVPVEIVQHIEEENGVFEVEYFLWGFAQVTVWGKPYKLLITDILDTKNNPKFSRQSIGLSTGNKVQAVRVTLHGSYEIKRVHSEIKLRFPKCILRRPSYSLESLKCMCDTIELPSLLKKEHVLPLSNKNLARIIFRWRQILYAFRSKHESNQNNWLWEILLGSNTQLGKIAKNVKKIKSCEASTAIDKFLLVMLLWREKCSNLEELGRSERRTQLNEMSISLIGELYEIGIPIPVLGFLWKTEDLNVGTENPYSCPIHTFTTEDMMKFSNLNESKSTKMTAALPDRVIQRLLQRWPGEDGWLPIALHLGLDLANIKNLASKDNVFPTIKEKRLTVFKLWRMKHRRDSASSNDIYENDTTTNPAICTTWDLCKEIHDMGMPSSIYNFLWLDSETTP